MHFSLHKTGSLINEMIQDIKSGEDTLFINWSVYNPYFTLDNILESLQSVSNLFTDSSIEELIHFTRGIELENKSTLIIVNEVKPLEIIPAITIFSMLNVSMQVKYLSGSSLIYKDLFLYFKSKGVDIFNNVEFCTNVADKSDYYMYMHGGDRNSLLTKIIKEKSGYIQVDNSQEVYLTGNEDISDLRRLARCITVYFGRTDSNVRKVFVPENYDFMALCSVLSEHSAMSKVNRYANNLDYNRSVYLMNSEVFYDTESVLIKEDRNNKPPVSVIYYEYYNNNSADIANSNVNSIKEGYNNLFNLKWGDYWYCNPIFNNLYKEKKI